MKKHFSYIFLCLFVSSSSLLISQESGSDDRGFLSLGVRNSLGFFFTEGKTYAGTSVGGQLGLHISDQVNSHWFGDFITTDFGGLAKRVDAHGGFSVMPAFHSKFGRHSNISVFPLAGFCIDYTRISITNGENVSGGPIFGDRYSFATQFGIGAQVPLSERLDFSVETHYMLHIGTDIDVDLKDNQAQIIRRNGTNLEGHLLFAISIEYKLFRLWGRSSS